MCYFCAAQTSGINIPSIVVTTSGDHEKESLLLRVNAAIVNCIVCTQWRRVFFLSQTIQILVFMFVHDVGVLGIEIVGYLRSGYMAALLWFD